MASGVISFNKSNRTSSGSYVLGKITYSYSQSTSNNTSTVTFQVYVKKDNDSTTLTETTNGTFKYELTVNGEVITGSKYLEILSSSKEIGSFTRTISHDNNGSKTLKVSGSVWLSSNSSSAYYGLKSYVNSSSGSVALTTIPRASSITSVSSVTLGNKCSVKWIPMATSFVYKLAFACGGISHTTEFISPGTTSEYTYTGYTMDISKWAAAMPKDYSATCTVTLYTYQNSSSDNPIGSSSATFTLSLSSAVPTISFTTASGVNTWTAGDGNTYYLQSISSYKLAATFTAGIGSYISSCSITGTGLSLSATGSTSTTSQSLSGTTSVLSKTGTQTYTAKVTDGRTSVSATKSITVYAYAKPVLSLSAVRSSNSGFVNFTYSASCSNVNSQNSLKTLTIHKKTLSESVWTTVETISLNSMSASNNITISGFDTASSYELRATVTDTYGSSNEAITSISSEFKLINIQKNEDGTNGGVSIGKMSEEYIFDCALPARFLQNIEFGKDIQGNLKTSNTTADDGVVRNIVYLQTGQDVDGGATMGLAVHNASVYVENAANSGKVSLGSGGRKWNQLYATNGTISTSDRSVKTEIASMSDVQERLFSMLKPVTFKFTNGSSGRTHYGFISQDVEDSLTELNLTGQDFAGFCKDLQLGNDGKIATNEDGSKKYDYSLRYSEFIALNTYMIQKLQLENQELRNELQALKEMIINSNAGSGNI